MKKYFTLNTHYMIRSPLQPRDFQTKYKDVEQSIPDIKKDTFFLEQLIVSSESL